MTVTHKTSISLQLHRSDITVHPKVNSTSRSERDRAFTLLSSTPHTRGSCGTDIKSGSDSFEDI
uniref:Uncharacterized protein n=1 Tax=Anguilla anguilla TaxID=7936 RepID=A0A0E9X6T5_ANGAN